MGRCWRGWSCCVGGQFSVISLFWFLLLWSVSCCLVCSVSVVSLRFVYDFEFWLSLFVPVTKKKDFFLGSCFLLSLVHPFFLIILLVSSIVIFMFLVPSICIFFLFPDVFLLFLSYYFILLSIMSFLFCCLSTVFRSFTLVL